MSSDIYADKYEAVLIDGKTRFRCLSCSRTLSTKQRIRTHFMQIHKVDESVSDRQLYSKQDDTHYRCNMCGRLLSSKRNVQQHLNVLHGKDTVKRVYKQYERDPNIPVPKRTLYRQKSDDVPSATDNTYDSGPEDSDHSSCQNSLMTVHESESLNGNVFVPSNNGHLAGESDSSCSGEADFDTGAHINLTSESDSVMNEDNSTSLSSASGSDESEDDSMSSFSASESDTDVMNEGYSSSSLSSEDELVPSGDDLGDLSEAQVHEYCVLSYAQRFNLSREATVALKGLASILSPDTHFKHTSGELDLRSFHYCETCNTVFPEDNPDNFECFQCHGLRYEGDRDSQLKSNRKPRCEFIITNIQQQLKHILEKPGMWDLVKDVKYKTLHQQGDGVIHDIVDGSCYKELCEERKFLSDESHLSAVMNTDGIPLYSSTKVKLWPVFLAVNEIPPLHRFARDNLIVAGMWQGKSNPPFQHYLRSFANEMNKLYVDGVFISPQNCAGTNVKICVILATLDLQAKGYVANMSMHNGSYGCSACEEPGVTTKKGKGHVKSYPYRTVKPPARNSNDVSASALQATRRVRVKGICGVSGLSYLHGFDLVRGLAPDYMHGILLGVTKTLLKLWFSSSNSGCDYYIGKKIKDVSSRVHNMTPPDTIERLPRDFEKSYEHFKATELQVWLLYYSLPCLNNILGDQYLQHFSLLSESTFLLLGDNITRTELDRARSLLDKFYKDLSALYGPGSCGLNVHNVGVHLVEFVSFWGPLWCWSCFPFEDCNADILQTVHGTGNVKRQYLQIKQQQRELNELRKKGVNDVGNKKAQKFLHSMLNLSRKWFGESCADNCKVVGRPVKVSNDECFNDLLRITGSNSVSDLQKCFRVELLNQKYYSQEYSRMQKRVCYFVISNSGEILSVNFFVVNKEKQVFAIVHVYEVAQNCYIFESSGRHIVRVTQTDQLEVVPVSQIMDKLFYLAVENEMFVSRLPNALGRCVFK